MNKYKKLIAAALLVTALSEPAFAVTADYPDSDSRIKTMVFNESDVYTVVARHGFQTEIQLAANEVIDTISIGDSIGWQITPAVRRIFVKPLQKNGVTNLSVITNRRSYQFELVAASSTGNVQNHAYVVKFYYPEENQYMQAPSDRSRGSMRPVSSTAIPELPESGFQPVVPVAPVAPPLPGAMNMPAPPLAPLAPVPSSTPMSSNPVDGMNFNYTLTGPENSAPSRIYDDGKSTYFQFKNPVMQMPRFAVVRPDGTEIPVVTRQDNEGKVVVDQLASKFIIRDPGGLICVFNERMSPPQVPATRTY